MLIITGTGRCGTATLARIFGGHHEFRGGYILDKYFLGADPSSDPFDTIEKRLAVMLDLHQGIDRRTFVDSSNLYIHFIDALYMLDPSVKFALSVRNGRDFVRSAFSRRWHEQNIFGTVPLRDDAYYERWPSLPPIQKNAWIWVSRNSKALDGLKGVPEGSKIIVKIEDIGKEETLRKLESYSGIEIKERKWASKGVNANPSFELPPKEEWTTKMNEEFDEIAREMMRFFGYGED
ncbi:MAG: hypothetical protein M0Z67_07835 [Nitrospiraceae bacterium]|nr:hypothetical protein [Nitrospiraceae bacterium]